MYPEPVPFSSNLPPPGSTIGHKLQGELPFIQNILNGRIAAAGGSSGTFTASWADLAFNPLSTLTPLAPAGQASYPDTYRVQRALGAIPAPASLSSHASSSAAAPASSGPSHQHRHHQQQQQSYTGDLPAVTSASALPSAATPLPHGISRRKPDLSFLDAQARELLIDQEKSFAANANFPWAASLSTSTSNNGSLQPTVASEAMNKAGRNSSLLFGSSSSLTREVGIITL